MPQRRLLEESTEIIEEIVAHCLLLAPRCPLQQHQHSLQRSLHHHFPWRPRHPRPCYMHDSYHRRSSQHSHFLRPVRCR